MVELEVEVSELFCIMQKKVGRSAERRVGGVKKSVWTSGFLVLDTSMCGLNHTKNGLDASVMVPDQWKTNYGVVFALKNIKMTFEVELGG